MLHRLGAFGLSRFGNQARAGLRSQNKKVCLSFASSKLLSRQVSTTRSFLGTSDRALFLGHGKHFGLLRNPNSLGSLRCFGVATALHFPLSKHTYSGNKSVSSELFVGQNVWNEQNPFAVQVRHFSIDDRRRERERRRQRRQTAYADPEDDDRFRRRSAGSGTLSRVETDREASEREWSRRESEYGYEQEERSTLDAMDAGQAAYLRKVYMYTGSTIGVASIGAFGGMLFPISPIVPGLLSLVPLIGIMMTDPKKSGLRLGMLGAFGFLSGMSAGPMIAMSLHMDPLILPMALLGSCGIMGGATLASLFAKEGSLLKFGAPLAGLTFALLGLSIVGIFFPHPILFNLNLYGGLVLFTAFTAYDTHMVLEDYKQGNRDVLAHATNFFINFMAIFRRLLFIFMSRDD